MGRKEWGIGVFRKAPMSCSPVMCHWAIPLLQHRDISPPDCLSQDGLIMTISEDLCILSLKKTGR